MKNNFKETLKLIMLEKGLTQEDLAEKLGLDQSRISKWQTGKRNPSVKSMEKIAKALNVSVSDLLNFKNKEELDNKKEIKILKEKILNLEKKFEILELKLNLKEKDKN